MQIKVSKLIPAPLDRVFRFLADGENAPRWAKSVKSARRIEGTSWGLGSRVQYSARILGMDFEFVTEAQEFQLNERFLDRMIRKLKGPLKHYEAEGIFQDRDGSTMVTMIIRGNLDFPAPINWIMEFLLKLGLKKRMSKALGEVAFIMSDVV